MTDASYCHETGAAGFGFWAVSERGKLPGGLPFKQRMVSVEAAEMAAVVNALVIAKARGIVQLGDKVLVQLDCMGAIKRLSGEIPPSNRTEEILAHWGQVKKGLVVNFKHVKGHSNIGDRRSLANEHCDRTAKKHMRTMREQLKRI